MTTQNILAAMSIIIALLIGYLFGLATPETVASEPWLYRWQTLVTGILAIGAAVITVVQMQRTDERQENRHSQILNLSLRSERLRARRATNPYSDTMSLIAKEAVRVADQHEVVDLDNKNDHVGPAIGKLEGAIKQIFWCVNNIPVATAADLFDERMSFSYETMKDSYGPLNAAFKELRTYYAQWPQTASDDAIARKLTEVTSRIRYSAATIEVFCDHLRDFGTQYA